MAVRKLETIHDLEELNLKPATLRALKDANVNVQKLVTSVRYYGILDCCQEMLIRDYPGIGKVRAEEIVRAVDEAGFILHESGKSRGARRLLVQVDFVRGHSLKILMEHYEELEDMTLETLVAVDEIIQFAGLSNEEIQYVSLRYGLVDGHMHTSEECADVLWPLKSEVDDESEIDDPDPFRSLMAEVFGWGPTPAEQEIMDLELEIAKLERKLERLRFELKDPAERRRIEEQRERDRREERRKRCYFVERRALNKLRKRLVQPRLEAYCLYGVQTD